MLGVRRCGGAAGRRQSRSDLSGSWSAPVHRRRARRAAGAGAAGQYARAVTPEQLQDVVRTAVAAVVDRGALRRRRCPTRSSSSARRTASTATTPPTSPSGWPRRPAGRRARWPSWSPRSCGRSRASPRSTSPVPASSTSPSPRARSGRSPCSAVDGGRRLRAHRGARRAEAQPRVRLGQPDRAGAHSARTRWAAVGDALARLLEASGADGDAASTTSTTPARRSTGSPAACRRPRTGRPVPEDGYAGDYIETIAAAGGRRRARACWTSPRRSSSRSSAERGVELMFAEIRSSLAGFGVDFDVYFSERTLHETGALEKAVARLREQGHVYEADGAVWLRTTDFGDDKDRVLVKADGEPTYFAADCAYYLDKRGARLRQGRDHARRRPLRLRRPVQGAGRRRRRRPRRRTSRSSSASWSTWSSDGEPVRMSKRAGNVVQPRRPGRGDRRRRRPLRPGPGVDRPADRHRPGPVEPADQRQPGLLRPVRARPDLLAAAQRRRPRARPRRGRRTSTSRSWRTSGRATCCGRSASSRGCSRPRPSCGRRTGSPATWRSWPAPTTASTTPAACCRAATRRPTSLTTARLWLCAATATVLRNGLAVLGVQRPGADVRAHPAGSAARRHRHRSRRAGRRAAGRPGRARPAGLAAVGRPGRRRAAPRRPRRHRPGPRARHPAVRARRGRLPRPGRRLRRPRSPTPTCTTRPRRSSAGRWPAGSPRTACTSTPAAATSWPWPWPPASRPSGSRCTATTSRSSSCSWPSTPGSATSCSTPSTRSTGWCRWPPPGWPPAARRCRC